MLRGATLKTKHLLFIELKKGRNMKTLLLSVLLVMLSISSAYAGCEVRTEDGKTKVVCGPNI
jgi:hypothetical protein